MTISFSLDITIDDFLMFFFQSKAIDLQIKDHGSAGGWLERRQRQQEGPLALQTQVELDQRAGRFQVGGRHKT